MQPTITNVYARNIVAAIDPIKKEATICWVRPITGLEEPLIATYTGIDGEMILFHGNDQAIIADGAVTVRAYVMGMTVIEEPGRDGVTNLIVRIHDLVPDEVNLE